MKALLFLVCILCCLLACQSKQRTDAEVIVREWTGKEIRFPKLTGDTARVLDSLLNKEYKVLFYADSTGCTGCRLNLSSWKLLIEEASWQFAGRLSFVFFFQPKDEQSVSDLLYLEEFDYPVFVDQYDRINMLNHFPKEAAYQCFLLDRDNKVVMIGNPVAKLDTWAAYKQMIVK
jgi:hypothetical protein